MGSCLRRSPVDEPPLHSSQAARENELSTLLTTIDIQLKNITFFQQQIRDFTETICDSTGGQLSTGERICYGMVSANPQIREGTIQAMAALQSVIFDVAANELRITELVLMRTGQTPSAARAGALQMVARPTPQ